MRDALDEAREIGDCCFGNYQKALERVQNALTLKGLSLCEAYVEGRLWFALEFSERVMIDGNNSGLMAVICAQSNSLDGETFSGDRIRELNLINSHSGLSGDKQMMLVGNIEFMDAVEFAPVFFEGFYDVKDMIQNRLGGLGSCFLSIDGSYRILPSVAERKKCVAFDSSSIGFDQGAVCVIKRSSEVMNSISNDGWCMPGEAATEVLDPFPRVTIVIGTQSIHVRTDVSVHNAFKLTDVMFGPFYF